MGPTAVGKTRLAVDLAQKIDAEIVCVDSIAVYRDFNVASAKPSETERRMVRHHLIDIVDPREPFSAGDFCRGAAEAMAEIQKRGKNILLVGGSGLYFRALFQGMFEIPDKDFKVKGKLEEKMKNEGIHSVYEELKEVDPETAAAIHPHDRYRILRALEVYYTTGKRFSEFKREHLNSGTQYFFGKEKSIVSPNLKIGLNLPREELHQKISERTDQMFKNGLLEEVSLLLKKYPVSCKPFQSVGYKEAAARVALAGGGSRRPHVRRTAEGNLPATGPASLDELKEQIRQKTRALARRQLTWFRSEPDLRWFEPLERDGIERLVKGFLAI